MSLFKDGRKWMVPLTLQENPGHGDGSELGIILLGGVMDSIFGPAAALVRPCAGGVVPYLAPPMAAGSAPAKGAEMGTGVGGLKGNLA